MFRRLTLLCHSPVVVVCRSRPSGGGTMSGDERPAERKADLKKRLSPIQYQVTQEKGTER